jgi:hypothetical protein
MYKFIKVEDDKFKLNYGKDGKELHSIEFRRTIATAQKLQSLDAVARFKVYEILAQQGYTMEDNPLITKVEKDGKEIIDKRMLNSYIEDEKNRQLVNLINDIMVATLGHDIVEMYELLGGKDIENPSDKDMKMLTNFQTDFIRVIRDGEVEEKDTSPSRQA